MSSGTVRELRWMSQDQVGGGIDTAKKREYRALKPQVTCLLLTTSGFLLGQNYSTFRFVFTSGFL
jgi:hypothetical protein